MRMNRSSHWISATFTLMVTHVSLIVCVLNFDSREWSHLAKGNTRELFSAPTSNDAQINDITALDQSSPRVAALAGGKFAVVWQCNFASTGQDICAKIFYPNGTALGNEFIVNDYTTGAQIAPDIASLTNGGFVIVWVSANGAADNDIYAKIYDENGSQANPEFLVNSITLSEQLTPSVTCLVDGRIVIVWTSPTETEGPSIFRRIFQLNGTPLESDFQVSSVPVGDEDSRPRVCALAAAGFTLGGFVIVWTNNALPADSWDIFFAVYDVNLACLKSAASIDGDISWAQSNPSVSAFTDGGFLVVYDYQGSGTVIEAIMFDSNFNIPFPAFVVNTPGPELTTQPSVAVLDGNNFIVAWQAYESGNYNIYASVYNGATSLLVDQELIHSSTNLNQASPHVVAYYGGFLAVWNSDHLQIGGNEIFYRTFSHYNSETCTSNLDCAGSSYQICNNAPERFCSKCDVDTDCVGTTPVICKQGLYQCASCLPTEYGYNGVCYPICPPVTYPNMVTRHCQACALTTPNCEPCNVDSDCNIMGFPVAFCDLSRCTTLKVQFVSPLTLIQSNEVSIFALSVQAEPGYSVNWLIQPTINNFEIITDGIKILPFPAGTIPPTAINVSAQVTSLQGESKSVSITVNINYTINTNSNSNTNANTSPASPATSVSDTGSTIQMSEMQRLAVAVMTVPIFVSGVDPTLIWSFINLMQMLYYLLFLNVDYPSNLREFLGLFALGRVNILPNPFSGMVSLGSDTLYSPPKFFNNQFSGLFLDSVGSIMAMIAVSLFVYAIAKILTKFSKYKFATWIVNFYEWSGFLRIWLSSYSDLMFASLLQLCVLNFHGGLNSISSLLGIVVLICNLGFPVLVYWTLKKVKKSRKEIGKYQALTEDYDLTSPQAKFFATNVLAYRLLRAFGIVFLYHIPLLQVIVPWLIVFVHLILLILIRPHHKASLNFTDIVTEIGFFSIHSLIIPIAYNEYSQWFNNGTKEKIGWIIIACCLFIIAIQLVLIIHEQYSTLKNLWNSYKSSKDKVVRKPLTKRKLRPHSNLRPNLRPNLVQNQKLVQNKAVMRNNSKSLKILRFRTNTLSQNNTPKHQIN